MSDKKIQRFTRPSSQPSTSSRISFTYFLLFVLLLLSAFVSVYRFSQRSVSVQFISEPVITSTVQLQNDDIVETFFGIDQSNMYCEQYSEFSSSCSSGLASPPKLVTLPPYIPSP